MSTSPAFFSYSRADTEFALRLAKDLRAAGANVWLDQLDIKPGQRWDRAVEDALANCPHLVVVLSPASVDSANVMDEVSLALEDGKTVIPVVYRECKIPFRLRRLQYVDLRLDYSRGLSQLLETFGITRQLEVQRIQQTISPTEPVELKRVEQNEEEHEAMNPAQAVERTPISPPVELHYPPRVELGPIADHDYGTGGEEPGRLNGLELRNEASTSADDPVRQEATDKSVAGESSQSLAADAIHPIQGKQSSSSHSMGRVLIGALCAGLLCATIPAGSTYLWIHRYVPLPLGVLTGLLEGLVLALVFYVFKPQIPKKQLALVAFVWPVVLGITSLAGPSQPLVFITMSAYTVKIRLMLVAGVVLAGALTGLLVAWGVESKRWTSVWLGAASFSVSYLLASLMESPDGEVVWAATSFVSGSLGAGTLLWFVFHTPKPGNNV